MSETLEGEYIPAEISGKVKIGRPSNYVPGYAQRLTEAMESGKVTIAMVCRDLGISRPTFYRYLDENEDFKEAYDRGKVSAEAWWDEVGIQGMLTKKLDATIYCAFRNNISGWKRQGDGANDQGPTVNIGAVNIINQVKGLSTEQLEAEIAKKLAKLAPVKTDIVEENT